MTPAPKTPNQAPRTKNEEPVSKSSRAKRRLGRPKKPKKQHAVTLTLTLPTAAFRTHLKRTAKACGHKTPSALIIATFPLPPTP